MKQEILHGDCLDVMKVMESNSVDAIVTDPPYGLSFMGKKWDYDVPSQKIWEEALRVLKPGGYLLAFAGTRTQHRMAVRIEDAGFEIRDMIAWVYGSGFPKSLNIGKAVDKLLGNEREITGISSSPNGNDSGYLEERYSQKRQTKFGVVQDQPEKTKGSSEFEGFGTALKPALEPITVARKPLSEKTVAENCLKWGVGGIDIDGSRVATNPEVDDMSRIVSRGKRESQTWENGSGFKNENNNLTGVRVDGRFPANLIHDGSEEVVSLFPNTKSGAMKKSYEYTNTGTSFGKPTGSTKQIHEANEGSAARFFYQAKASRSERGSSNNHPTVKPIALMEYLVKLVCRKGSIVLDPFAGSGTTAIACKNTERQFIVIERDLSSIEIIHQRLSEIKETIPQPYQPTLFDSP